MAFFKKKNKKTSGKGTVETRSFNKGIEVLNYVPVDYRNTSFFASFVTDAEKYYEKQLKNVSVDDQCIDMFEPINKSVSDVDRASAREQCVNHLNTILHDKGVLKGMKSVINSELEYLQLDGDIIQRDLDLLNEQYAKYNYEVKD